MLGKHSETGVMMSVQEENQINGIHCFSTTVKENVYFQQETHLTVELILVNALRSKVHNLTTDKNHNKGFNAQSILQLF